MRTINSREIVVVNGVRNTGVLHRNGITAVDKLIDFVDASVTIADNGAGTGNLLNNTAYFVTVIPGNRYGACKVNTNIDTLTTAASGLDTHSIRATIAQCANAEWYDIFLSTDAAPKWVARITEAQRAAGDYEVTAVGTVATGSGCAAGELDINVTGTGIQSSNGVFSVNNAYTPASITAIDCSGYTKAHVLVKLALTDLRTAPSLSLIPFYTNQTLSGTFHQGAIQTLTLLSTIGYSLMQSFVLDINGVTGLKLLVDTISGQGAAVYIYVELS